MSNRLLPGRRLPELVDDRAPVAVAPTGRLPGGELITWLLLAALATAVLDQGGFHATAQAVLGLALAAAVAATAVTARTAGTACPGAWTAPAVTGFACAGWAFADGCLHGSPASGVRPALLVAATGAVVFSARRLTRAQRAQLERSVLWLGCVAGLLGWYGVAGHVPAFALTGQGVWRAMGTLGYPNTTAALLAMMAVASVAGQLRLPSGRPRWPAALTSTVLLTGLGATFSRGGLLAAVAGFVALAVLLGPRRVLAAGWAPALGAAVAVAGLLPGLDATAPPRLAVAAGALLAGLAAGSWLPSVPALLRSRIPRSLQALGVGTTLLAATAAVLEAAGRSDLHARFALSSTDRMAAWRAGAEVVGRHPVLGIGPGPHTFSWTAPHGGVLVFRYLHNEYLQILAEFGAVGLLLTAACLAAVVITLCGYRPRSAGAGSVAMALAVLVTVGVSALFDFTGHFPAIVLTAAALAGCAEPARPATR